MDTTLPKETEDTMEFPTPTTMDAKKKATLLREYQNYLGDTIEIEHLAKTIREGMNTDIKTHDVVISTRYYDAGVFVVDPTYKMRERQQTYRDAQGVKRTRFWEEEGDETPNPYTEWVTNNDERSRCASLSVKCREGEAGSRQEKRIKVKKLCLMAWDETTNSYPRQSGNIIFRERTMSFRQKYEWEYEYSRTFAERFKDFPQIATEERLENAKRMTSILKTLIEIPPFSCFYDEKYGFLLKREIRMQQVIFAPALCGLGSKRGTDDYVTRELMMGDPKETMKKQIETNQDNFKKHVEKRDLAFGEELVAVAMNPDRVGGLVEKYGVEAVEQTFG